VTDRLEHWRDPVFNELHKQVPVALATRLTELAEVTQGRHIYYERMHALLAVAGIAGQTAPPHEKRLGFAFGQAFHQGCTLNDVALAAGLTPDQVVEIGKRTIRRSG